MKLLVYALLALFVPICLINGAQKPIQSGPILYGLNFAGAVYKIDPMTCEVCPVFYPQGNAGSYDLVVLPNGDILIQAQNGMFRFTPPDPNATWTDSGQYLGSILAPNGLVYLSSASDQLWQFDPSNNTLTLIGSWPPNIEVVEFFYQNGVLYGNGFQLPNTPVFIEVDLNNPDQSSIVVTNHPFTLNGGFTNYGYTTSLVNSSARILRQYNIVTNTYETICDFTNVIPSGFGGLAEVPAGAPVLPCLCLTDAGSVDEGLTSLCVPVNATVPYNGDAELDADDLLHYILFSDPNDTLGSILATSNTPTIAYNPSVMQPGVVYYLATIAGDGINGNVDLGDPCIDISNAAEVIWQPSPTVQLTVSNSDVCAGGCQLVEAVFTGTPPFELTYTNGLSGGTTTQTFSDLNGTFEVCAPAGVSLGTYSVTAIALTDAYCTCE
jgi:hypothetical protein